MKTLPPAPPPDLHPRLWPGAPHRFRGHWANLGQQLPPYPVHGSSHRRPSPFRRSRVRHRM